MAKGKKSRRVKYTSKGERSNVSRATLKLAKNKDAGVRLINQLDAWKIGKKTSYSFKLETK